VCEAEIHYGLALMPTGRRRNERAISVEDAMIAATARAYALSVVTRDGADFAGCGVPVADPWLEDEA
jgi:hypothetical protein